MQTLRIYQKRWRTWNVAGWNVAGWSVTGMHATWIRRVALSTVLLLLSFSLSISHASAEEEAAMRFVRIGTGPTGGTYFPIGGLIANAISNPPGSRPCEKGGSCGVPGVIAVAQSTNGSIENIRRLIDGEVDLALVQAGIAFRAMNIGDLYEGQKPFKKLRALARLYPEFVHLAAHTDKAVGSVKDLRGKQVALGDPGSGTLFETEGILGAYGIRLEDITPSYGRPGEESDRLKQGLIDALFFISGVPNPLMTELLQDTNLTLVPIDGSGAERIVARSPFFTKGFVAQDSYPGHPSGDVWTLSVDTLLVSTTDLSDGLIEGITRAVWHPTSLHLYEKGIPQAAALSPEKAITGIGIPLHGGAQRVYFKVDRSG